MRPKPVRIDLGGCNVTLLSGGRLRLDGGAMFGIIPKALWSRTTPADDDNCIQLACNCLLVEWQSDTARRVIIETGHGAKYSEKERRIFGIDPADWLLPTLLAGGIDPLSISDVVLTHLHFDHAGGLTRRARSGEVPDWRAGPGEASGDCAEVMRTFPNAEVVVQRREWEVALANDAVMTRTYYRDHLLPIADRVRLADSARPFPTGVLPHRDETPRVPLSYRETTVLPGIGVFLAPGHTWGQQAIRFVDVDGRSVVFTPDVMPSVWHVGAAYSLAYDVEPYTSMVTKRWFLEEAARGEWTLVLDHEPRTPVVRAAANGKGWYDLTPVEGFGR